MLNPSLKTWPRTAKSNAPSPKQPQNPKPSTLKNPKHSNTLQVNARKLEHAFRLISAGIPSTLT